MHLRLQRSLPRLTNSKVVFKTFWGHSNRSRRVTVVDISDCQRDFEKKTSSNKYCSFLPLSMIIMVIHDSWFLILEINGYLAASFSRFQIPEKQKLIKTKSQKDQVTWVDQRHVKVKSYEKKQLKLKYHLLRRKYYILKKVLHFRVSAVY